MGKAIVTIIRLEIAWGRILGRRYHKGPRDTKKGAIKIVYMLIMVIITQLHTCAQTYEDV